MQPVIDPFKNDIVPFVVESIGELQADNSFTIDIIQKNGLCKKLFLPPDGDVLRSFINPLSSTYGKKLPDLLFFDILFDEQYCNGVYMFFDGEKCEYVGSNASRAIVDRVGGHLALRQRDYLNSMVKYLARRARNTTVPIKYCTSADICNDQVLNQLSQLYFAFVPVKLTSDFESFKRSVELLEDYFIHLLRPCLQAGTNKKNGKINQVDKKYKWK